MRIFYLLMFVVTFCVSSSAQTQSVNVEPGWNLLSLPLAATDSLKSLLFPSAVSSAFIYQDSYLLKDTIQNGPGFWLKFDSAETILLTGETIHQDTINVSAGWNMIGSISEPVGVNNILSDPPGIASSQFFNYPSGSKYEKADTILPGFGYWIKVNQNGKLILSSLLSADNHPPNPPSDPNPIDDSMNVNINVNISWRCTDTDGDPLTYDVYFGTTNPPLTIVSTNQSDTYFTINGLMRSATYYWKVVAKDKYAISRSGPAWKFTTLQWTSCGDTIKYFGKTYHTGQIGTQCWLKENLNVGTMIDSLQYQTNNSVLEKYCYRNDPNNCNIYGGLYQWDEAMQYSNTEGARGVCPTSWHIPTSSELQTLISAVGNDGNMLKAIGQGNGTNASGFSALLAGWRAWDCSFWFLEDVTYFWSSTEGSYTAPTMNLYYEGSDINFFYDTVKENGFSVRCVKD